MDVLLVGSLEEALDAKADRPHTRPIAGGTDLMVAINAGTERPSEVLDLTRVDELDRWELNGDLFLGAGVTYTRLQQELGTERALIQAARSVGSPQIRNRGTVGGNIGTASPAGDLLPVIAASNGVVELAASGGRRRSVAWDAFFRGPKQTSILPDELILGVRWRRGGRGVFAKVGRRNAMVISIASTCLLLDEERGEVRLALGSVGPTVLRARDAERFAGEALGEAGSWEDPSAEPTAATFARFAELATAAASPIDDQRGSADYRRHAVGVLAARLLRWVLADRRTGERG